MSEYDPIFDFLKVIPAFEVGQRVRVLSMLGTPGLRAQYIGQIGHITGKFVASGVWIGQVAYFVSFIGKPTHQFTGPMLEAFIPGGHTAGSWDACPWAPDV